jgi:hypothetical protein
MDAAMEFDISGFPGALYEAHPVCFDLSGVIDVSGS